ncbi:MAG: exo-alpha-sialidase [Opitutaceae bacterium]|nr:exo-alpha-sialidase [Opitutaceae bacterium]
MLLALMLGLGAALARAAEGGTVTIAPMAIVRERPGITGAGWGAAYDVADGEKRRRKVVAIYPNHPDDWGKTTGTGLSYSWDDGKTWTAGADNTPIPQMVDLWQDQLADGTLVSLGIRDLPDPKKPAQPGADGFFTGTFTIGVSTDGGGAWTTGTATVRSTAEIGPIARPLPRIFLADDGAWLMPAYSWSPRGSRALLLKSTDRGRNWAVAATVATAEAVRALGVPVTTPWFEHMVARTADGSLLAVVRSASNARGALVTTRSVDHGVTWSAPERLLAGPGKTMVAGKLPNLTLLPNGVLVLLTAHTKNHCRIYVSWDGRGREWSEAYVVTSQTGGNTSLVPVGRDQVLVLTPATGRIAAWTLSIRPASLPAGAPAQLPAPTDVRVTPLGAGAKLTWSGPAGGEGIHYQVTPVLVKAVDADMQVERYAPIEVPAAVTSLALERNLAPGGTYRFELARVDRAGGRSPTVTTPDVTLGAAPKPEVN